MSDLGHTALGAWSGGVHMHFGLPLEHDRLKQLLRPGDDIATVITADVYGTGDADSTVGEALAGLPRESYRLVGMIGHDFYDGERAGAKGFPRFTDPALRDAGGYADYLRSATERSLERCGVDHFDVLMLHNPDHIGYSSPAVWDGMAALRDAGLASQLGVAPGPANGFTLDVISCLERFGDRIDWAMLILNPFEPWPGRLALPACERAGVSVIARVVDYGGVFWDDAPDEGSFPEHDHRSFRPAGWVGAARAKLDQIRPIADRHQLTPLQLAAAWTLSQPAVACVAPTLIQEAGSDAKPIERKRIELAAAPAKRIVSLAELAAIDAIGDNTGCMALKGGSPTHDGASRADAWALDDQLRSVAERWGIAPERDLVMHA
jgi:aryl-alcohol dehydrogenase-like predicted oxidoreductase